MTPIGIVAYMVIGPTILLWYAMIGAVIYRLKASKEPCAEWIEGYDEKGMLHLCRSFQTGNRNIGMWTFCEPCASRARWKWGARFWPWALAAVLGMALALPYRLLVKAIARPGED